ncbi:hypothetical protein [Granulicella paludicola]|uniref:hypothetical protein n=1 Tax=Granulicella paludicola TaxID=474951 RepID=UPI0021E0D1B2|nr:hypothetical protein [Granulicella paludicola]
MLSEWNAECSPDSPTLVVPWADANSTARFIDLRAEPYDIAEIPEAELQPTLGRALRSLNATRSPLLTAKCDAWTLTAADDTETLEALRLELMLAEEDALYGFASYIDLIWRERSVFASAHQQQDRLDRIVRRAQKLPHNEAALECVLRPAFLDLNSPLEGFAVTLYVTALGPEPEIAHRRWELALEDIVTLLRSKELEPQRGSATIDAVARS